MDDPLRPGGGPWAFQLPCRHAGRKWARPPDPSSCRGRPCPRMMTPPIVMPEDGVVAAAEVSSSSSFYSLYQTQRVSRV